MDICDNKKVYNIEIAAAEERENSFVTQMLRQQNMGQVCTPRKSGHLLLFVGRASASII